MADRDSVCEAVVVLDPIQLLFNGMPEYRVVDEPEDKQRLRDLPKAP